MDCSNIDRNELAEEYLNGALDEANQSDFEIHILECQKCLQAVEMLQVVRFDLTDRAPAIRSQNPAPSHWWFRWQWAAIACSLTIVGVWGLREWRRSDADHPQSVEVAANKGPTNTTSQAESAEPKVLSKETDIGNVSQVPHGGGPAHQSQQGDKKASDSQVESPDRVVVSSNSSSPAETAENPPAAATVQPAPPTDQTSNILAELAAVRPLPYTFAGVAATQPSGGGSVKGQHRSGAGVSESEASSPNAGAGSFHTAPDYFRDGMLAYVKKDYPGATKLLEQAVQLDPEMSEANLYLGVCRLLQGNAPDAVSALQPVARVKKPALAQPAHFYLAKAYLQMGKLTEADTELHAASLLPGRLAGESNALMQKVENILNAPGNK